MDNHSFVHNWCSLAIGLLFVPAVAQADEPVSLVEAAKLATAYVETEAIEGKKMADFFTITGMYRVAVPVGEEPDPVAWIVHLSNRKKEQEISVFVPGEDQDSRRVLEILRDGSVRMAKTPMGPRRRIVLPKSITKPSE